MIHCDLCGGWIKEKDYGEKNVMREHNFIACDNCIKTWQESFMMFYHVFCGEDDDIE